MHAICCTGANLEEDLFNLLAYKEYEIIPDWRALSAQDEKPISTTAASTASPTPASPRRSCATWRGACIDRWKAACEKGERKFESEFLYDLFRDGKMEQLYQIPPENSWLLAAQEKGIPVYSPGWEDSTTGNMFAAGVLRGAVPHHQCVKSGTEQMEHLIALVPRELRHEGRQAERRLLPGRRRHRRRLRDLRGADDHPGSAARRRAVLGLLRQISDAVTSYGGYSGAVPNEKITWGKLDVDTPKFMIQSDATIVAPLIFALRARRLR